MTLSNKTKELIKIELSSSDIPQVSSIEASYPKRSTSESVEVLRVAPSPTGFVHIGTIYASLINERIAHQSGGKFILRIEDTDKKREVRGSAEVIVKTLDSFKILYDEGPDSGGDYGPYFQSKRRDIYLSYAMKLLDKNLAYPCFASSEELQENLRKQQAQKVRPGYYGSWAIWRDKNEEEVIQALSAGLPFVLRFRSDGNHNKKAVWDDVIKGKIELAENDLDVPLIKSDDSRLPTYHFAHAVDDYLMQVTKVFRSDEWLPSTPLHMQLSSALGHQPFVYGHFAPISILDKATGGKRKLSKRKDDEADVSHWLELGYPIESIKAYLFGLANSDFEEWYKKNPQSSVNDFQLNIKKLASSRSPLLDVVKLNDYSRDYIANLSYDDFYHNIFDCADNELKENLLTDSSYTKQVLMIERDGQKPRKDMVYYSQAKELYGYFFDDIFIKYFKESGRKDFLSDYSQDVINKVCHNFLITYDPSDIQSLWFEKMKIAVNESGFTTDNKQYKLHPDKYHGNTADFARIIRVKITGRNRTPDLWQIMQIMGQDRVVERLKA